MQKTNPEVRIDVRRNVSNSGEESPGYASANVDSAAHNSEMVRFHGKQGHGFAAEQGNDLIDKLRGNDAKVVGNDNKKNGPDRLVNGQFIQTKYYQTAKDSINAGFDKKTGLYKYYDANNNAMAIEVPKDQYEKAVEEMVKKIKANKVSGYENSKNPEADARKLVKKGHLTYQQAKNIAKAGTVESLTFDAVHGAIICTSVFGITAVVTFAKSIWDGNDIDVAVEESLCAGIQVGGIAFTTSVISAQLVRVGLNSSLQTLNKQVIKTLFNTKVKKEALVKFLNYLGAESVTVKNVVNKASKMLTGNEIVQAVTFVVLSANDISNSFQGKISGKQLFKNMTNLVASLGGGVAGFNLGGAAGTAVGIVVGNAVGGPVGGKVGAKIGFWIGGLAGSTAGGVGANEVTNKVLSEFIEDDAVAMVAIINKHFVDLAQEFLLTQEEVDLALDDLKLALDQFQLLEMFASPNRDKYADDLLRDIIEKIIVFRSNVTMPSENAYFEALLRMEDRVSSGRPIIKPQKVDVKEIGRRLTGKEIGEREAKKAWYVTKNMNAVNMQIENLLINSKNNEIKAKSKLAVLEQQNQQLKNEIYGLLGE